MRIVAATMIAGLAAVAPWAARSAEPLVVPVSTDAAIPVTSTEFDWNGFYAGVYGVTQVSPGGAMQYGLGVDLGLNARFEFVLVGAEIAYQATTGGAGGIGTVRTIGRVGVAATDEIVLYAAGGLGLDLGLAADPGALLGGGVEFAVSDDVSIRGQYLYGVPLGGAAPADQITIGANFHF